MDTVKLLFGSTLLIGGAMYFTHCCQQKKHSFIKCSTDSDEYMVNPKYIRWVKKTHKNANTIYDVCTKQYGCGPLDTMRVHPHSQKLLEDYMKIPTSI